MGCSGSRLSGDNCEDGSEQPEGKQASIVVSLKSQLLKIQKCNFKMNCTNMNSGLRLIIVFI